MAGGLQGADGDASAFPADRSISDPVQSCGKPRKRIEVLVIGDDDQPVADVAVSLAGGRGEARGKTDVDGRAPFDGLDPGAYRLSLYRVDQAAWEIVSQSTLPDGDAPPMTWQPPAPPEPQAQTRHTVEPGDCLYSVADRYGHLPATLSDHPSNQKIKSRDPGSLHAGDDNAGAPDEIFIPAARTKTIDVQAGQQVKLRRKGTPAKFRAQLLAFDGKPYANADYVLELDDPAGGPPERRQKKTDQDGVLNETIPPSTRTGTLTYGPSDNPRKRALQFGHLNPADHVSGVQGRLRNLGYFDGSADGTSGDPLRAALTRFQAEHGLSTSGEIDQATRDKLRSLSGED